MSVVSRLVVVCCLALLPTTVTADTKPRITGRGSGVAYVFPFFYGGEEGQTKGMWMATSLDGLHWSVTNDNEVVFERPFGTVFRDPAISQGPDGTYHMVWTIDWKHPSNIGYAHSTDLIHWQDVREVNLMGSVQGAANVWAPELIFDEDRDRWMIYWGSGVEGRFDETRQKHTWQNNRMYCAFTTDFTTFTPPKLLFGDHIVNDTRIINAESPDGRYCMITKHIVNPGQQARLYLSFSSRIDGPYHAPKNGFEYISDPYEFCEGPAVIKIGDWFYCYFDLSRKHRMACKRSKAIDAVVWEDVTDRLTFPEGVKHGDVLRVPLDIYQKLNALSGRK